LETDYNGSRKVVLNCLLTYDSIQHLSLSYSNPLGKNIYDEVKEAKVALYSGQRLIGYFHKSSFMQWTLKYVPQSGRQYRIVVDLPDGQQLTATTRYPYPIRAERVRENDDGPRKYWKVEPSDVYWVYALYKELDTIMRPVIIEKKYELYEALGTDNPNVDRFNIYGGSDYYVGMHKTYIRMLPSETSTIYSLYNLGSSVVVFCAVSEEYDKYLKSSLSKMYVYENFDDPTQWLDESMIYSNVNNGLGIFGAYDEWMYNCNDYLPD
jgi:hypothetical protein